MKLFTSINNHLAGYLSIAILISFAGCTKDDIYIDRFINIDNSSFTFDAGGARQYTVKVSSSDTWQIKSDGDEWLTVGDIAENSFTLKAAANETGNTRTTTVTVGNGYNKDAKIDVTQIAEGMPFPRYTDHGGIEIAISKKGTYLAYVNSNSTPVVINQLTGESKEYSPLSLGLVAQAVSDNGTLVLHDPAVVNSYIYDENGNLNKMEIDGYFSVTVSAISSDGTIMVGYAQKGITFSPVKWTNGNYEFLEIPAVNVIGHELTIGAMARGCSVDGSVIYGSDWNDNCPIVWKNGTMELLGADLVKALTGYYEVYGVKREVTAICTPIITNERTNISANGKYLAVIYSGWDLDEEKNLFKKDSPIIFDLEGKEAPKIFDEFGTHGVSTITNDGTLFYRSFISNHGGFVYEAGRHKTAAEWILEKYGLIVPDEVDISFIAEGGKMLGGNKWISTEFTKTDNYWSLHVD